MYYHNTIRDGQLSATIQYNIAGRFYESENLAGADQIGGKGAHEPLHKSVKI